MQEQRPGELTLDEAATQAVNEPVAIPQAKSFMPTGGGSIKQLLAVIANALARGDITAEQAKSIRNDMGIKRSYFTKAKRNKTKEKHKKKIATASRRRNRGLGKGETRMAGKRFASPRT